MEKYKSNKMSYVPIPEKEALNLIAQWLLLFPEAFVLTWLASSSRFLVFLLLSYYIILGAFFCLSFKFIFKFSFKLVIVYLFC